MDQSGWRSNQRWKKRINKPQLPELRRYHSSACVSEIPPFFCVFSSLFALYCSWFFKFFSRVLVGHGKRHWDRPEEEKESVRWRRSICFFNVCVCFLLTVDILWRFFCVDSLYTCCDHLLESSLSVWEEAEYLLSEESKKGKSSESESEVLYSFFQRWIAVRRGKKQKKGGEAGNEPLWQRSNWWEMWTLREGLQCSWDLFSSPVWTNDANSSSGLNTDDFFLVVFLVPQSIERRNETSILSCLQIIVFPSSYQKIVKDISRQEPMLYTVRSSIAQLIYCVFANNHSMPVHQDTEGRLLISKGTGIISHFPPDAKT